MTESGGKPPQSKARRAERDRAICNRKLQFARSPSIHRLSNDFHVGRTYDLASGPILLRAIPSRSLVVPALRPALHANVSKRLTKTPKLYFHDVGLASWLLGVESAAQLATHPLRGALFENLVVCDVLKYRYNSGRRGNLHFYRDSSGLEIDLIYPLAGRHLPIEIKAGRR
jgi:hypothetical protein